MKRIFLISSLITLFLAQSWAAVVNVNYAQQVAQNFYNNKTHQSNTALTLAYTATDDASNPVYYVFNAGTNYGFIIVSAESTVKPILGYNLAGSFSVSNISPSTTWWMAKYRGQIIGARATVTEASAAVSAKWAEYYNNTMPASYSRSTNIVGPLCNTSWNQNPYYNDSCPYDKQQGALTVTGCVATAMAQIMKYWSYPQQGTGVATDQHSGFGNLTVNLADVTYDWTAMPNSINSNNAPIAQLMYDCGVAAGMGYGVDGSGAEDIPYNPGDPSALTAYSAYFGYNANTIQGLYRENYPDSVWIPMLQAELDTSRLIEYGGFESSGEGHSWVCDGYDETDTLFHMNWGWGGANDGYYSIDNLDPSGLGPSPTDPDSNANLNYYEDAIIGIEPGVTVKATQLALSSYITFSQSPYVMNTPVTITVPVSNMDTGAFNGSFSAAIYDQNGVYEASLQQYQNVSISAGKDTVLTFTTNGLFLFPGNYTFGLSYQTKGIVSTFVPPGNYLNPAPIQFIEAGNTLFLDSNITITTGIIAASTPFAITATVYNNNIDAFSGTIGAALFDLNGNFAGLIDSNASTLLFADKSFTYTFSTTGLDINPGEYYLAIYSRDANGTFAWTLVSDSLYANPVEVTVGPQLNPDIYEINNVFSETYTFVPAFNNASAAVATTGSNMHIGTDVDYYTVVVPTGGFYTMSAQVYDSQNPNGADTYTNDVVFKYTTAKGDSLYSDTYDGAMPEPFHYNGGDITFKVADKVAGTIGTYLLKIQITNDVAAGIVTPDNMAMTIYPNPTNDAVVINPGNASGKFELAVFDLAGKKLLSRDVEIQQGQLINENLAFLDNGMYIVRLLSDSATHEAKVIVNH